MNFVKLHHVAIICKDYEKSKRFYVDILGLKPLRENYRKERNSFKLDLNVDGSSQIELFSFPDSPPRLSRPEAIGLRHLAFAVEDVEETKKELENQGVMVEEVRVDESTGRKFTFFADPDDLPLEIYEA